MIPIIWKFITRVSGKDTLLEVPDHHSGYSSVNTDEMLWIRENKQSVTFGCLSINDTGCVKVDGDLVIRR